MTTQARFKWTCSYMGSTWYHVDDETGSYEAEFRRSAGDYELSIANGDDCRRDIVASVGILRRSHCSDSDLAAWRQDRSAPCFAVPQSTVDAFNAWRAAERETAKAQILGDPVRYGAVDESDPFIFPPIIPARRGWHVAGFGWQWEGMAPAELAA